LAETQGPGRAVDGGCDREHPIRLRPWEGGINLEAILTYLRTTTSPRST
jgi:hypothetical protein